MCHADISYLNSNSFLRTNEMGNSSPVCMLITGKRKINPSFTSLNVEQNSSKVQGL